MAAAEYRGLMCNDPVRRQLLLAHPTLNGIDYIEVVTADQRTLRVTLIKDLPPGAYGLAVPPYRISVQGGVRERNIEVQSVAVFGDRSLDVRVDRAGDFSTYTLAVDSASLDPAFARRPFTFKAGCPQDFDCRNTDTCPPSDYAEPAIDYMAKDYASFRQALLDFLATRNPEWTEQSPADLGMALVELLAYVGDHLSYYQDAVANEAFLETARQRESVRRHARLVDYTMHDGANARAFVLVRPESGATTVPAGTPILTRMEVNLGGGTAPPYGAVLPAALREAALSAAAAAFAVAADGRIAAELNELAVHDWGNQECCLSAGTTGLDLVGHVDFRAGDFLLLEEVIGPATGNPADADPAHRQVVRLIADGEHTADPLLPDPADAARPLPLTRVRWAPADALAFPLCLSARLSDASVVKGVSVARGNVLLADHGRLITEWHPGDPADPGVAGIAPKPGRPYRFRLSEGPMTFRIPLPSSPLAPVAELMQGDVQTAVPAARCQVWEPSGLVTDYVPARHLLDAGRFTAAFVVETDNSGTGWIRFGNDEYGLAPAAGSHVAVTYRVGNGAPGNVGAGALVHLVAPDPLPAGWPAGILEVRNPLPAWGGTAPEPADQVKRLAPAAFRAVQYRAVTEADYAAAAETHREVSRAVATFQWTGSWYTAGVAVDPAARTGLEAQLAAGVQAHLARYELSGYDVEIDAPAYVPLEIELEVCARPDHFRADVREAVLDALSAADLPGGVQGFFHPDRFTFGQPVYLSALYAAVEAVEGVDSVQVATFRRWGRAGSDGLAAGRLDMGRTEIARLDNDPNFPENGVLRLKVRGGR